MMKSKHYFQRFLLLALGPLICSFILFYSNPSDFYYRAWEYHEDLGFKTPVLSSWHGPEYGDLSRDNFFYYQDKTDNNVTIDRYGFRSNAFPDRPYKIAVLGASQTWGTGVNDSETIPWRLADLTQVSTFNASRANPFNTLKRRELQNVKLIIDCVPERALGNSSAQSSINGLRRYADYQHYVPTVTHNPDLDIDPDNYSFIDHLKLITNVPSQRWLFSLSRYAPRLFSDLKIFLKNQPKAQRFKHFKKNETNLKTIVAHVETRQGIMKSRNYDYIFVPLPAKQTLLSEDTAQAKKVDAYTLDFIPKVVAELGRRGIPAIDLVTPMKQGQKQSFYQPYDTHLNAKGIDFATRVIARQLKSRGLLPNKGGDSN